MRERHRHNQCIKSALERAERICRDSSLRLTPIRRKVLELIWQSHKPIKAYDILAQLSSDEHIEKPPTVYRALDFLLENHLIHKIESCNAYVGCEMDHSELDSKFFVCDTCQEVKEVSEPKLDKTLAEASKKQGFIPNQTTIEIHGTCARCTK
jgi:Fur family zinc uptake transcriptional regulator